LIDPGDASVKSAHDDTERLSEAKLESAPDDFE
jgi:hypothetical protein